MIPTDTSWPFEFKRIQFPLQICYGMTINKSQGQSLDMVGLYLPRAVFSHGHVYVAISRVTRPEGLHILIDSDDDMQDHHHLSNLDGNHTAWTMKVRVTRMWVSTYRQGVLVRHNLIQLDYEVLPAAGFLRPVHSTNYIMFLPITVVVLEPEEILSIPRHKFDLVLVTLLYYSLHCSALDELPIYSTDVIGIVELLQPVQSIMTRFGEKEVLRFRISDGVKGGKSRTVALKAEEESPKAATSRKDKGKALFTKSDTESSSSESDDDSDFESLPETDADEEMMKLCALMKNFRRSEGRGGKSDRGDYTNVKCYNCGENNHISPDCKKVKGDKGKALVTKQKSWTDTSDSESEENYALMANADKESAESSSEIAETKKDRDDAFYVRDEVLKMNESLKTELEKEREIIRTWTNSGRTTQNLLSSENWKEGLCYGEDKNDKGTVEIKPMVKQKPKLKPVKFVTVKSDNDKLEVREGLTSDKLRQEKTAEVNIGLMTKKQLKHKLKDVKNVNKVKSPRKNRNGKEGVNKRNDYKPVPDAPRKTCHNCGSSNHLASFCRKNKNINSLPSKSGVKSQSVRYKSQNPCFHCGSLWHSIYTCKEYHSLYYNYYQLKPSLKKVSIVPSSVNSDSKSDSGNRKNILVLDSGCSGHMTGNKALLSDFVEKAGPSISYGDGNIGKTLGYGNINLGNVIIKEVALV
ncbi:hypothetical protein AgCh_027783 [Apium graveolens]